MEKQPSQPRQQIEEIEEHDETESQEEEQIDLSTVNETTLDQRVTTANSMVKNNMEEAITILEETLKLAEMKYPNDEFLLARYHYALGNVLLHKVESSKEVFGDAIQKDAQEESSEKQAENKEPVEPYEDVTIKEEPLKITEMPDESNTMNEKPQDQPSSEQPKESGDDADDLQVAWEHLEVSRINLEACLKNMEASKLETDESLKQLHTKILKNLAEIMVRLGDANCHRDNFDGALQDYERAVALRKNVEDQFFSRDLAEIYYLCGNAHLYRNHEDCDDKALFEFNKARLILENILYKLMDSSSFRDPEDPKNQTVMMSREFLKPSIFESDKIKEVKEVLVDLYNKIEDTQEQKKERQKLFEEMKKAKADAESTKVENTFAKPVLQVSGEPNKPPPVVKNLGTFGSRKRKADDITPTPVNGQENQQNLNPQSQAGATKVDDQGHVEKMIKQ